MIKTYLSNQAYELSYNFLLTGLTMLFFLISLLGVFAHEGSRLRADLFTYVQLALPPTAYQLLQTTLNEITRNTPGGKLTFGLLFALISGSAGMTQLITALNTVYEVRET